jgi:hypothetical protein
MAHQPAIWTGGARRLLYRRLVKLFGPYDQWKKTASPQVVGKILSSMSSATASLRWWAQIRATPLNTRYGSLSLKLKAEAPGRAKRKMQS